MIWSSTKIKLSKYSNVFFYYREEQFKNICVIHRWHLQWTDFQL